jgi:ribonucleoside-diphosphate reductase alpha chain
MASAAFPGVVAATAAVIRWRCEQLKALPGQQGKDRAHPAVLDAMFSRGEPHTGTIRHPGLGGGRRQPRHGRSLHADAQRNDPAHTRWRHCHPALRGGLLGQLPACAGRPGTHLSLDMRVIDPAWIGMKLRKLLNYAEPLGSFMAFIPGLPNGERRQQTWPSTVAYLARLIIHRYAMLGVLDESGFPLRDMGVLDAPEQRQQGPGATAMAGKVCPECGNPTVIHKDGCEFCTSLRVCGAVRVGPHLRGS